MAKQLAEHNLVAGAQRQAWLDRAPLCSLENKRRVRENDAPKIGMVDPLQAAARMHVLIIHNLGEIANRRARYRGGKHPPSYFVLSKRSSPAFDQLVDSGDIGNPHRARKEPRI